MKALDSIWEISRSALAHCNMERALGGLKAPQPHLEEFVYRQNRPTRLDKIKNPYAKIQTGALGSSDLPSPQGGLNFGSVDKERGNRWHSFYVKGVR